MPLLQTRGRTCFFPKSQNFYMLNNRLHGIAARIQQNCVSKVPHGVSDPFIGGAQKMPGH